MFTIEKMCPASEWYYLSRLSYYSPRSRKKLKKRRSRKGSDDASPDDDSDYDPDGSPFGEMMPYRIDMPGEPPGKWSGGGSLALGISGYIHEEHYHRIFHGFHPRTNEPLVQNAGMPDRCAGYEGCFSSPLNKSFFAFSHSQGERQGCRGLVERESREPFSHWPYSL